MAIAAIVLSVSVPLHAENDETVDDFIAVLDYGARSIYASVEIGPPQALARCRELMSQVLEIDTMARAAVGATWERMSVQQRDAYRSAFEARMASQCVRSMRAFRSQKVILAGVRQTNGERMVTTSFVLENEAERLITWRLRGGGTSSRAIDVIADGRSAVATARSEFAAVLESNNGNVEALIASMQR